MRHVWGGESPAGYDCSGLVQAAYRAAGISLPRTAQEQYDAGHTCPPTLGFGRAISSSLSTPQAKSNTSGASCSQARWWTRPTRHRRPTRHVPTTLGPSSGNSATSARRAPPHQEVFQIQPPPPPRLDPTIAPDVREAMLGRSGHAEAAAVLRPTRSIAAARSLNSTGSACLRTQAMLTLL
ncbi:MAG: C40 family peptidase [Solirubrobacteraceae bacterium]